MSCDVIVSVLNKTADDVLGVVEDHNIGQKRRVEELYFTVAGFWFSVAEDTDEDGDFGPGPARPVVRLVCTTNMGWSLYGDTRGLQIPIAHTVAQCLAMYLNTTTMMQMEWGGLPTYYRRTDHPEVHAVLDYGKEGMSLSCPNFCQQAPSIDGPWALIR